MDGLGSGIHGTGFEMNADDREARGGRVSLDLQLKRNEKK